MSLTSLLAQTATVHNRTDGAVDRYDNPVPGWSEAGVFPCRLEMADSQEVTVGGDTQTADWRLFLPPAVPLDGLDRVEVDGRLFEVVGPPNLHRTPRGPHHLEARLRSVG